MNQHVFADDGDGDCLVCGLRVNGRFHVPVEEPVTSAPDLPVTPYAGTSGWSGSQTSRERAEDEDRGGVTTKRQRVVLALLADRALYGITWRELAGKAEMHHGQASGVLSGLHKAGHVARLASERRERCAVYVLPEFVADRETASQGRTAADPDVVTREEWRVVHPGGRSTLAHSAAAAQIAAEHGGVVQTRSIIETPWREVD